MARGYYGSVGPLRTCERAYNLIVGKREDLWVGATGVLYSGTFGRAHSYEDLLVLMELLRSDPVHLAFSIKGHREEAVKDAFATYTNVSFVPFASKACVNDHSERSWRMPRR